MPLPSVEPMPLVPAELRFSLPLEAQEASYLAASASTASLRLRVSVAIFLFILCSECLMAWTTKKNAKRGRWSNCDRKDGLLATSYRSSTMTDVRPRADIQLRHTSSFGGGHWGQCEPLARLSAS